MLVKPDIALFMPSLRGGGAERVMVILAGEFVKRGFAVDLVLASKEGAYLDDVKAGVNVIDLGSNRTSRALPKLAAYLRRNRPRALLSTLTHANITAWAARALSRAPTRVIVREANTYSRANQVGGWHRRGLARSLMRLCYARADGVIAVSKGVKADLEALGVPARNITVIYNPTATPDIAERARMAVAHPFFDNPAGKVIVGAGRLTEQKDYPALIAALKLVRARTDARLILLGEGPDRAALEAKILAEGLSESVSMPGFDDNPFAYMARADLFVLSSKWEGLPNTLIQAMACGTPVVSTDCPSGPSEILEGGKWGRLVPVGDTAALAAAMLDALDDPSPPDVQQRAADFGVDRAVDAYLVALGMKPA